MNTKKQIGLLITTFLTKIRELSLTKVENKFFLNQCQLIITLECFIFHQMISFFIKCCQKWIFSLTFPPLYQLNI
jgi:hypothetical protein